MSMAYMYIRYSSAKQERGSSHERQLEMCLNYCQANGYELAEPPIKDLGVSAWKGNHLSSGNLGHFAQRVQNGEIPAGSILVVEHLDRLSRQEPRKTQRWLEDITDLGLRISIVIKNKIFDQRSLRSPEGMMEVFELLMDGYSANKHSETLSNRLKKSWAERRAAAHTGKFVSSRWPKWLRVVGEGDQRRFEPIPERVETIRKIYELAANGVGLTRIVRMLNESDTPSLSGKVSGWEQTYIFDILRSPAVEGHWVKGGVRRRNDITTDLIKGYFGSEPIIEAELIARARAALASRKRTGGKYHYRFNNLFTGVINCGLCGSKMTLRTGKHTSGTKKHSLQCSDAYKGRKCGQRQFFNYPPFERSALDAILHLVLDDRYFERPDDSKGCANRVAEIEAKITLTKAVTSFTAMNCGTVAGW
jgi:DNA invertase Pin-like site-specific DNA recombinase